MQGFTAPTGITGDETISASCVRDWTNTRCAARTDIWPGYTHKRSFIGLSRLTSSRLARLAHGNSLTFGLAFCLLSEADPLKFQSLIDLASHSENHLWFSLRLPAGGSIDILARLVTDQIGQATRRPTIAK